MLHTTTLCKTPKGLEEIEKRTFKLAGRLRAVLIMIDGQRSVGDLLDQAGALSPQLEAQFEELAAQGFVEAIGGEKPVQATPVTPTGSTAPARSTSAEAPASAPRVASLQTIAAPALAPAAPAPSTPLMYATPLREALVSSELPAIDGVPAMKNKLQRHIAETMGMKGMLMQAQLQACGSRSDIERLIDDIAREVSLANGSKQGEKWRERSRKLVELDNR
jgi:DNA-binding FrmR family transcriptional regulator